MIKKWKYIFLLMVTAFILCIIVLIPSLLNLLQDAKILNVEKVIAIEPVQLNSGDQRASMSLSDKIALIVGTKDDFKCIDLKMGDRYSLYEARMQCFKELSRIPALQMDLYGPIKDEINVLPKLYIDVKSPTYTMIVWKGTITINKVIYQITLDEESNKIIYIKCVDRKDDKKDKLLKQIDKDWQDYIKT